MIAHPPAAIDKAALIEAAAKAVRAEECERLQSENLPPLLAWHEMLPAARFNRKHSIETALPVIAAGLLAPLRELHQPNPYADAQLRSVSPSLPELVCAHCATPSGGAVAFPCPTARLLDQIESDAKGDER